MTDRPVLRGGGPGAAAAVLVLHGGQEANPAPTRRSHLPSLRMLDLYAGLRLRSRDCAVYRLRYRVVGWNGNLDEPDPVVDARWALDRIADLQGDVPVALLGHSMGGRTALAVADRPTVVGVCALAPWLPEREPLVPPRPDLRVVLAHGTADRMTSAELAARYAARLRATGVAVARFEQPDGRHALLDQPWLWHRFAVTTTLGLVGDRPLPRAVRAGLDGTDDRTLRLPLDRFDT